MLAKIFTKDPNITDILKAVMHDYGFSKVEFHEPSKNCIDTIHEDIDQIIIIDTDYWMELDRQLNSSGILLIRSYQVKWSKDFEKLSSSKACITKPFSSQQVSDALDQILKEMASRDIEIKKPKVTVLPKEKEEQLLYLEKSYSEIKELHEKILFAEPDERKVMFQNKEITFGDFPLKKVLIVELDKDFMRLVNRYLSELGVFEIYNTGVGLDAWGKIESETYDLIIIDWNIVDMEASGLYNRIRGKEGLRYVPIVISLSKSHKDDLRLIKDDFCAELATKPFQKKDFTRSLCNLATISQFSTCYSKEVHTFLTEALEIGMDFSSFKSEVKFFLSVALRSVVEALILNNSLSKSEEALKAAWQLGDSGETTMASMARVFHLQSRHGEARRLINQANALGPDNAERLCLKGEIGLYIDDLEMARGAFSSTFNMDRAHSKALAGLDLADRVDANRSMLEPIMAKENMSSPYNLLGIQLSRNGEYGEALKFYKSALSFLHTKSDKVRLLFNVGLCYKRAGLLEQAEKAFQTSYKASGGTFEKALDHITDPKFKSAVKREKSK